MTTGVQSALPPPKREKRERARSAVLPESRILTWSPHYHCWVIPTGCLDENSYHQGAKNRQTSQILTFLSITSRCIHLFPHHSPFSMAQEASSPSPNSSLLLPACHQFSALELFWVSCQPSGPLGSAFLSLLHSCCFWQETGHSSRSSQCIRVSQGACCCCSEARPLWLTRFLSIAL